MNSLPEIQSALEGRYHVVREIGQGGMATVYLVRDLKHDRDVALKVLRAELAAIIGADRFLAEIKVTAHLQHPHILPLFDSGSANGVVYYVMPFIDGESLRHRLDRDKQLPVADAVRIATEVAGALDYAHRHGVIHRDVKPENILLHDGRALVADFGIALAVSTAGKRMTETGMSVGTPQYMSPEQAMGALEITARSDVYSLGATTYEMLIGEPPFTGATAQAIVARVLTATPQSITAQRHTVSRDLEAAVLMALEKLPADRFATCTEFAEALSPRSAGVPTERITSASVWRGRVAKTPRQTRIARAAAGMAMLAAGALGGWLAARPSAPATLTFDQKTFKRLAVFNARFAPDGKTIVFSAATEGTIPNLYVIRPE